MVDLEGLSKMSVAQLTDEAMANMPAPQVGAPLCVEIGLTYDTAFCQSAIIWWRESHALARRASSQMAHLCLNVHVPRDSDARAHEWINRQHSHT